ncbi:MAG: hypothetical protein K5Q00_03015 [Gammaproteobacteria bacterium]|nr:hypothetical protein [Gammaproteobacteria bacterium]
MDAKEWLQFMTPFIAVLFIIFCLASIPLKQSWREHYKLPQRKLILKKSSLVMCAIIIVTYLIIWVATYFTRSNIQITIQAINGLLLIISLVLLGLITFIRMFQKNNLLSLWLVMFKRQLPLLAEVAAPIIAVASVFIVNSLAETTERQRKEAEQRDPNTTDFQKNLTEHGINPEGGYCDKGKALWYHNEKDNH